MLRAALSPVRIHDQPIAVRYSGMNSVPHTVYCQVWRSSWVTAASPISAIERGVMMTLPTVNAPATGNGNA
jgi:hypothetical protein